MHIRCGLILMLLMAGMVNAAEVFRWVDSHGVINYSDVPPPDGVGSHVQAREVTHNVVEDQVPWQLRQAVAHYPVQLFAGHCGDVCDQARQLLKTRGIPYTERDPQANNRDEQALTRLIGKPVLPVLEVGSQVEKGFLAERWNAMLDVAGYPKTPMPGSHTLQSRHDNAAAPALPGQPDDKKQADADPE